MSGRLCLKIIQLITLKSWRINNHGNHIDNLQDIRAKGPLQINLEAVYLRPSARSYCEQVDGVAWYNEY
jgi:hypothetical protein